MDGLLVDVPVLMYLVVSLLPLAEYLKACPIIAFVQLRLCPPSQASQWTPFKHQSRSLGWKFFCSFHHQLLAIHTALVHINGKCHGPRQLLQTLFGLIPVLEMLSYLHPSTTNLLAHSHRKCHFRLASSILIIISLSGMALYNLYDNNEVKFLILKFRVVMPSTIFWKDDTEDENPTA